MVLAHPSASLQDRVGALRAEPLRVSGEAAHRIARVPHWFRAEYEAGSKWKRAENIGSHVSALYWRRRLQNILAAKARWQSRNNVVSLSGVPV